MHRKRYECATYILSRSLSQFLHTLFVKVSFPSDSEDERRESGEDEGMKREREGTGAEGKKKKSKREEGREE